MLTRNSRSPLPKSYSSSSSSSSSISRAGGTPALLIGVSLLLLCGCPPPPEGPPAEPPPAVLGDSDLLAPPGKSEDFLRMEVPPNHFTHTRGIGERFGGVDAAHVAGQCLNCHTTSQTSFATEEWAVSLHALLGIGCEACHGAHEEGFVPHPGPDRCRACHPQQEAELRLGEHVDEAGSGLRCDSCHRSHTFDVESVKDPKVCATCHLDSAHAQGYAASKMGVVFAREGYDEEGVAQAATCYTCHVTLSPVHDSTSDMRCDTVMNHDVSAQLARLPGNDEVLTDEAREAFVEACLQCHARSISEYRLRNADPLLTEWKAGGR